MFPLVHPIMANYVPAWTSRTPKLYARLYLSKPQIMFPLGGMKDPKIIRPLVVGQHLSIDGCLLGFSGGTKSPFKRYFKEGMKGSLEEDSGTQFDH